MEHINIIGDTFNEDHDKVFDEVFENVFAGNVTKVPKAWHAVLVSDLCTTTCHGVQNSLNDCHDDRQVRWCSGGVHAVHVVFAMSVQRQTDRTNRQDRQTDRHTDRPTDRQTDRQRD